MKTKARLYMIPQGWVFCVSLHLKYVSVLFIVSVFTLKIVFHRAVGSSMDVAAVQTEAPEELDYNKELVTVGGSNLVAGCLGVGLTGSYIFSQVRIGLIIDTRRA